LNTEYISESVRGFLRSLTYVFFFYVVYETSLIPGNFQKIIYALLLGVILMILDGFYQLMTMKDFIRGRSLHPLRSLWRVSSSFCHPNDFGAYLITLFFPCFSYCVFFRNLKRRVSTVFLLICMITLLILTYSRGAWLGFLVGLFLYLYYFSKKILLHFCVVLVIITILLPSPVKRRILNSFDIRETAGTTWERYQLWKGTLRMVKEHPLFGFGINTYSRNFPRYKPEEYPDLRYAHNSFLQMASEIGILGLFSFLVIVGRILQEGFKKLQVHRENLILLGFLSGTMAFLVHSFLDNHLFSLVLLTLFWLYLGVIFSLAKNKIIFSHT